MHIGRTGQDFVVLPQVTVPVGLLQVPFLAEQVVLVQVTVPPPRQLAVQVAFSWSCGRLAAKAMAPC